MANQVKDLTSDQLRRIFRDYLTGRPKEKLMKKYDISEDVFWEIVGMYSKKKHPNDVGNAQDIDGPADLLVSPLDTGSTATEHPIVARNPEDLAVTRGQVVKEFDYDSPEEELRKKGGEVNDLVRDRTNRERDEEKEEAREVIASNKEATDAILEELTEVSKDEKASIAEEAVEGAKATPPVEEILTQRNEQQETTRRAEVASEAARDKAVAEHAEVMGEKWPDMVEAGKQQNEESLKKQTEARQKEADERAKEVTSAGQESGGKAPAKTGERPSEHTDTSKATSGVGGQSNVSSGSGQGAGGNKTPREDSGNLPRNEGKADGQGGGDGSSNREAGRGAEPSKTEVTLKPGDSVTATSPANTSPTAQPNPVEPAKVEPMGLKEKPITEADFEKESEKK